MFTGDLSDFSLREILRFLTSTEKPGVLKVRSEASTAGIALHDGGLCFALLDLDGVRGLAARMVRSSAVDVERLRDITGRSPGDAIASAIELAVEASETADAADVCLEHTYEVLGWLTHLDTAMFEFEHNAQLEEWPFATAALDDVFTEVDERAQRWSKLPDAVGDLSMVCSLLPDVPDSDVILSADQWRTVALVDGRRTVGDLVELSGMGHLDTCTHLHELVEGGLIELVPSGQRPTLAAMLDGLGVERPGTASASSAARRVHPPAAVADAASVTPDAPDDTPATGTRAHRGGSVDADDDPVDGLDDGSVGEPGDVEDVAPEDDDEGDAPDDGRPGLTGEPALDGGLDTGANQALLTRLLGRKGSGT